MSALEILRLRPGFEEITLRLLAEIAEDYYGQYFSPHPFTRETIASLAAQPGLDYYYLLTEGDKALAYGLLRGWNEGYIVPSLGLAVSPRARCIGLGRLMMDFLHAAAQRRDARHVRLRVHAANEPAIALYRSLGYQFSSPADPVTGLVIGMFTTRQ